MKAKALLSIAALYLVSCGPRAVSPRCDATLTTSVFGEQEVRYYPELRDALNCSRQTGRPVLLMFTGYNVASSASGSWAPLRTEEVRRIIDERLILCALLVDDRTPLVPEDLVDFPQLKGNPTTIGQRNQWLESEFFNSATQPLYVLVDSTFRQLTVPHGYGPRFQVDEFITWIEQPLEGER